MFNQVNRIVYKQSLTSFKETIVSSFRALIQGIKNGLSTTFYLLGYQIKTSQTCFEKVVNMTFCVLNLFA